ncbi:Sentrin-specific protease [Brachionus plicatilis]|uniref:Sentrin-specific protease n=1 Tax=Brachionus plicatilis TaxID=10195 RepID=A0A3M7RIC2_BRAPC|nr:Sentrin-specific protease [Brachionus plicatilis]
MFKIKVSKLVSTLSIIFGPCIEQFEPVINGHEKRNNILNFGCYFSLSIVDLIDREQQQRHERKQSIVLLSLNKTIDDKQQIYQIFKTLKQPMPIKITRLKTTNSKNYPEPVICDLISEHHVKQILNTSYKLKSINEFKNIYINQHLTVNERIIDSLTRQTKMGEVKKEKNRTPNSPSTQSKNLNKSSTQLPTNSKIDQQCQRVDPKKLSNASKSTNPNQFGSKICQNSNSDQNEFEFKFEFMKPDQNQPLASQSTNSGIKQPQVRADNKKLKPTLSSANLNPTAPKSDKCPYKSTPQSLNNLNKSLFTNSTNSGIRHEEQDEIIVNDSLTDTILDQSLVLKTKNTAVFRHDILSLHDKNCLNDVIINIYFELLSHKPPNKCISISSFVYIDSNNQTKLKKWYVEKNAEHFNYYLIPIYTAKNKHWSLVIINTKKRSILHYDPYFDSSIETIRKVKNMMGVLFDQLKCIKNWTHLNKENINFPKQLNNYDCGPFICLFARQIIYSQTVNFSNDHIKDFLSQDQVNNVTLINDLAKFCENNFNILQLNVNSFRNKAFDIHEILDNANFDIVCLNETRLENQIPSKPFLNPYYKLFRYDRPLENPKNTPGGGIIIYSKFEYVYLQILNEIDNLPVNLICCYKPPNYDDENFLEELDDLLLTIDIELPLFIIGDLNMDLLDNLSKSLKDFMTSNGLINYVIEPTRTVTKFYRNSNKEKTSNTLIDVVLHNGTLVNECKVYGCSFSDHQMVATKLNMPLKKKGRKFIVGRSLTKNSMELIKEEISKLNLKTFLKSNDIDESWENFKTSIISILDRFAPHKKIFLSGFEYPWFDDELVLVRHNRDTSYKELVKHKKEQIENGVLIEQLNNDFKY